jgi:hypothetical protein
MTIRLQAFSPVWAQNRDLCPIAASATGDVVKLHPREAQ